MLRAPFRYFLFVVNNYLVGDFAMKSTILISTAVLIMVLTAPVFANSAPVVSNVSASQRGDDSKLVDIYYNLADADADNCTVWVTVSLDGGLTWSVPAVTLSGAIGAGIAPGTNKQVVWDAGQDMPGKSGNFKARVFADDGNGPAPMVMVGAGSFPYQNQTPWIGVDAFLIDKYEVTNLFYCQFLNAADPDGDHWDSNQEIVRHGNPGSYTYTVQSGRENYPIRYVNFYDAEAFAAWRSSLDGLTYRLPSHHEWEKAAGWDPVQQHHYTYGFHSDTIDCSKCNYNICVGGPTIVSSYDPYKSYYGCYDMSGNVWEWTSSIYSGDSRVIRGGGWSDDATGCAVTFRSGDGPSLRGGGIGFRLVLDF